MLLSSVLSPALIQELVDIAAAPLPVRFGSRVEVAVRRHSVRKLRERQRRFLPAAGAAK